jgi:hypothetical protein
MEAFGERQDVKSNKLLTKGGRYNAAAQRVNSHKEKKEINFIARYSDAS